MPRGGSIINMTSINGFIGRPDLLDCELFCPLLCPNAQVDNLYCDIDTSTKGAITSFTRGLSNQIISDKMIRVNGTQWRFILFPTKSTLFDTHFFLNRYCARPDLHSSRYCYIQQVEYCGLHLSDESSWTASRSRHLLCLLVGQRLASMSTLRVD